MIENQTITEEHITQYLKTHPKFFEHYPSLLADLYIPNQHGSGAVSLAERQQLAQRDKIRVLDAKLIELIKFGEENDKIIEKIHHLSLMLIKHQALDNQDLKQLTQRICQTLREEFAVPYVDVHVWTNEEEVESELRTWVNSLAQPYCGHRPNLALDDLFIHTDFSALGEPKSFALVPLRVEHTFGFIALASENHQRFYPEMGTLYLSRIGDLVSAALTQYID